MRSVEILQLVAALMGAIATIVTTLERNLVTVSYTHLRAHET